MVMIMGDEVGQGDDWGDIIMEMHWMPLHRMPGHCVPPSTHSQRMYAPGCSIGESLHYDWMTLYGPP